MSLSIEQKGTIEAEYGGNLLMPMRCEEAPLAVARNSDAHRIFQEGWAGINAAKSLPKTGFITEEEAKAHQFSFLQIAGVRGGEGRRKIANASGGLTWDRVTSMEEAAQKLLLGVGGQDIVKTARYGYKFVAFIETRATPEEFYDRFINTPTEVWNEHLPENIADVQRRIQNRRRMDSETRDWFLDTANGLNDDKPLKTAFERNGKTLFGWDTYVSGDDMWETNDPDSMPYSIKRLAESEDTDRNTSLMLWEVMEFLEGNEENIDMNRFWVQFNFGPDAACCNASSVSQANFHKGPNFESSAAEIRLNNESLFQDLLNPSLIKSEKNEEGVCSKCNMLKNGSSEGGKCNCKESN